MASENVKAGTGPVRLVTTAPLNTPCGWTAYGETGTRLTCQGGRDAVHILTATLPVAAEGTALCAFHSPWDMTDAERVALGQPLRTMGDAGAEILAMRAEAARLAEADNDDTASTNERYGMDTLAELLTLDAVAEVPTFDVVKFHKLSVTMTNVIRAMVDQRGKVSAWYMRAVILARQSTVEALIRRGIVERLINDNDGMPGSLHDYVLTDTGASVAAAMGCPIVHPPVAPEAVDALVSRFTRSDCDCDRIAALGGAGLPDGGDVCMGCGSVFTVAGGQAHPGILAVSGAVVKRNQAEGN